MTVYVAREGDCVASIAQTHGTQPDSIWYAAENSALRELRGNGALLLPGDLVFIPKTRVSVFAAQTNRSNRFVYGVVRSNFALRLRSGGKARAGMRYTLELGHLQLEGMTDGDGVLRQLIPSNTRQAMLVLHDRSGDERCLLKFGSVGSSRDSSGLQVRLSNLGYLSGSGEGHRDDATRSALYAFQRVHGLVTTGDYDEATRAKLVEEHGL